MPGELVHFVFETVNGQEDVCLLELAPGFALFGMELGRESQDGAAPLLEVGGDVDDESGADGGERGGVQNFEGTVRFTLERQLLETGEEAPLVTERRGVVVVGVAGFPIRKDNGLGSELANYGR